MNRKLSSLLPDWLVGFTASVEKTRWEHSYPIWAMTGGTFINTFGGSMVFPIFTLYYTSKFGLTLAQAGLLSTLFVAGGFVGQPVGGFIADRMGRKRIMVFALCAEAVLSMGMALAPNVPLLILDIILFGLLVPMFNPAMGATVADIVKPERRSATYGLIRVAANAGIALGPTVAALLLVAQRRPDGTLPPNAYLPLFVADAVTSLIFAVILGTQLYEPKPKSAAAVETGEPKPVERGTGYGKILGDTTFMIFVALYGLMNIVYSQMNTTFGVYMNQTHGIPPEHYGFMLASNAALVVLFQFAIARWVGNYKRENMLALGAALYAVGFGLIGFVSTSLLFEVAIIIITLGEMVIVPASQTLSADLSPADMRGRYQAVYGLMAGVGYGLGPVLGGLLFDANLGQWMWIGSLILGLIVAAGYKAFGPRLKERQG